MLRGSLVAWFIVAVFVLGVVPPASGQETSAAIRLETGIVFGKGGTTELKLDLAAPKDGAGPFPAIVCIHAGGWIGGERQQMRKTLEALARRGYVAISPDYRVAPRDRFPAPIEDCKAAVRWLRAHAEEQLVNPERIGAFGYSAGAHLACMLGVTNKDDGLEGEGGNAEQSSRVQAVASFFGPTDFTSDGWSEDVRQKHLIPLLGGASADKAETYRKASPLTYAGKTSPPFLLVHGTEDTLVPIQQSRDLANKLREAGASAKFVPVEGEGHGWKDDRLRVSIATMLEFFDENLKK